VELWQSLLVAFGGNAALLVVLGFLGRSLLSSVLAKDVEKFKAALQVAAVEHQARFTTLHNKRAEVLAELYKLLVAANWAATSFAHPFQFVGDPDKQTLYGAAIDAIATYYRFFDQHRIWLPSHLCEPLEAFAVNLRTPTIRAGVYVPIEYPTPETRKESLEAFGKAWEAVQTDIPKLRASIEAEFRALLGASDAHAG